MQSASGYWRRSRFRAYAPPPVLGWSRWFPRRGERSIRTGLSADGSDRTVVRRWHGDCAKWLRTTRLDVNYKEILLARHVLIARHANGTRPRAAYELRVSFGVETWPRTPVVSSRADAVSCVLRPSGQSAAAGPLALGTPARSRPCIERRWSRRT